MLIHILDLKPKHPLLPVPADWYPIYINKRLFSDLNIKFRFFSSLEPALTHCDHLFLSSRFFSLHAATANDLSKKLEIISTLSAKTNTTWFDFRDSTGNTQFEVLPFVAKYFKKQLLKNLTLYQHSYYGNRVYTDFIHNQFGVNDDYNDRCVPLLPQHAHKLDISWSPGLLDFRGGINSSLAIHLLTDKIESLSRSNHFIRWQSPSSKRPFNMLAKFNTNYKRNTVAWQRKNINDRLRALHDPDIVNDQELPLAEEINIRHKSKIILSLFGWGELCSRDFQAFIAGSALIAPDTSHLQTWPTTHIPRETYWPIKWDLSDIAEAYSNLIQDDTLRLSLANSAQKQYQQIWTLPYRQKFCTRLHEQLNNIESTP